MLACGWPMDGLWIVDGWMDGRWVFGTGGRLVFLPAVSELSNWRCRRSAAGCKYLAVWIWTPGYGFWMLMLLLPQKKRSAVEICMHVDAAVRRPLDPSEIRVPEQAGQGRAGRGRETKGSLQLTRWKGRREKNPQGREAKRATASDGQRTDGKCQSV